MSTTPRKRVPPLRHPRDATDLRVEAAPMLENVVIRTTAARLYSDHTLKLPEARRLKKQLDAAIEEAERFKRTGKVRG